MINSLHPKYYLAVDSYGDGGGDTTPVYIPPAPTYTSTTTKDKSIYKINIFRDINGKIAKNIPASGDIREIEILGTPGVTFSLTINKSDGCSILTSPINNVTIPGERGAIGKYTFLQRFPTTAAEETYDIQLTPSADVKLGGSVPITTPTYSIKQYIDPIVTLTNKATIAVTIPAVETVKGKTDAYAGDIVDFATSTNASENYFSDVSISWTIAKSASGYLYVKQRPSLSDWSNNIDVVKTVFNTQEGDRIKVEPLTTNIEEDMVFSGSTSIEKVLISSEDVTSCETPSNLLVLNNVNDLKAGVTVTGDGINKLVHITVVEEDCKKITISSKEVIRDGSILTFTEHYSGVVEEVIDNNYIKTTSPIRLLTGTELTFSNVISTAIISDLSATSGVTSSVISGTVSIERFGKENITFTQDLDNILTYTPNALDQTITVVKSTATTIDLLAPDTDENYRVKTPSVVTNPQHGGVGDTLSVGVGTIVYTPTTGYTGPDLFTFKVNDGTTDSDTKTIYITVK